MRKEKMRYKTSKGTGSLCELKPTSATRTFQCDCGAFGRQCGFPRAMTFSWNTNTNTCAHEAG
jgi:hypothetical protein